MLPCLLSVCRHSTSDRQKDDALLYIHLHQRFECATMEECIRIILQRNIDSFLPFFSLNIDSPVKGRGWS
jgi:hypothetical protein